MDRRQLLELRGPKWRTRVGSRSLRRTMIQKTDNLALHANTYRSTVSASAEADYSWGLRRCGAGFCRPSSFEIALHEMSTRCPGEAGVCIVPRLASTSVKNMHMTIAQHISYGICAPDVLMARSCPRPSGTGGVWQLLEFSWDGSLVAHVLHASSCFSAHCNIELISVVSSSMPVRHNRFT